MFTHEYLYLCYTGHFKFLNTKIFSLFEVLHVQKCFLTISDQMPEEEVDQIFNTIYRNVFRNDIFDRKIRCDGRTLNELRPISCEVDVYKPLHGSATFTRGQTQVCDIHILLAPLLINQLGSRVVRAFAPCVGGLGFDSRLSQAKDFKLVVEASL